LTKSNIEIEKKYTLICLNVYLAPQIDKKEEKLEKIQFLLSLAEKGSPSHI
jgi:hypothetical protein